MGLEFAPILKLVRVCTVLSDGCLQSRQALLECGKRREAFELHKRWLVARFNTCHELHIWANALPIFWAMLEDAWWNTSSSCCCVQLCLSGCRAGAVWVCVYSFAHAIAEHTESQDPCLNLARGFVYLNHGRRCPRGQEQHSRNHNSKSTRHPGYPSIALL